MSKKFLAEGICRLGELKVNQRGVIEKIDEKNVLVRRRLFDMGITNGVAVKIKKIAPLGDPVSIELRGYELALRKKELNNIEVRVVKWKLH